jgi:hypothetical protein
MNPPRSRPSKRTAFECDDRCRDLYEDLSAIALVDPEDLTPARCRDLWGHRDAGLVRSLPSDGRPLVFHNFRSKDHDLTRVKLAVLDCKLLRQKWPTGLRFLRHQIRRLQKLASRIVNGRDLRSEERMFLETTAEPESCMWLRNALNAYNTIRVNEALEEEG